MTAPLQDPGTRRPDPLQWAAGVIAGFILALVVVPAEFWRLPSVDAVYRGFDANLIYTDTNDPALSWLDPVRYRQFHGQLTVSADALTIASLPGSRPTVHLVTSPVSFSADFDARVLNAGEQSIPLKVGIWTPRGNFGFFLVFGGAPGYKLVVQRVVGDDASENAVGSYRPGQSHHMRFDVNRDRGEIQATILGQDAPPSPGRVLRITDGTRDDAPRFWSGTVAVQSGEEYEFGGAVRPLLPVGVYGFVLEWLDGRGSRIILSEQWQRTQASREWTIRNYRSVAPPRAAAVRLMLGVGDGADVLFANLFLKKWAEPDRNLLPNHDLGGDGINWRREDQGRGAIDIFDPPRAEHKVHVTRADFPELFEELRLSLTVAAESRDESSRVLLENYTLTLPHQRYLAVRTGDPRQRGLTVVLLVAAAGLCLGGILARRGRG